MIQPHFAFAFLQGGFHRPAQSAHSDERLRRTGLRRGAEIELDIRSAAPASAGTPARGAGRAVPRAVPSHAGTQTRPPVALFAPFLNLSPEPLQPWAVLNQGADRDGARRSSDDTRLVAWGTPQTAAGRFHARRAQPDPRIGRDFNEGPLPQAAGRTHLNSSRQERVRIAYHHWRDNVWGGYVMERPKFCPRWSSILAI